MMATPLASLGLDTWRLKVYKPKDPNILYSNLDANGTCDTESDKIATIWTHNGLPESSRCPGFEQLCFDNGRDRGQKPPKFR